MDQYEKAAVVIAAIIVFSALLIGTLLVQSIMNTSHVDNTTTLLRSITL